MLVLLADVTVAVSVTNCPVEAGFGLAVSAVVVGFSAAPLIVKTTAGEELAACAALPT